jgi:hypothetical protein
MPRQSGAFAALGGLGLLINGGLGDIGQGFIRRLLFLCADRSLPLGRGLHARPTRRRAWRDQRQFGVPDSRRGAGRDRPPSCRSAPVEALNGPRGDSRWSELCAPLLRGAQFNVADWRGPSQRLAALLSTTIKNGRKWVIFFGRKRRKVGRVQRQAARCFLVTREAAQTS